MLVNEAIQKVKISDLSESLSIIDTAKKILTKLMAYRRISNAIDSCKDHHCQKCMAPHLAKIISFVKKKSAITFVLPAFPGKSPNTEKVLGVLPDYAEWLALDFLGKLSKEIKAFYSPGIKIILCSDGRVFSDVVGIKEDNITRYQTEIKKFIKRLSLSELTTFNLDDVYQNFSFTKMREKLIKYYAAPLDLLKLQVKNGAKLQANQSEKEANYLYCGITRFLFEDSLYQSQTKSRTTCQKEARFKAYEVIRRSHAWSDLIKAHFPDAVRLSIHPQTCGSDKLSIRLIGNESWMTPWHGVVVKTNNGYVLMKRSEAESYGAKLISSFYGQYYQLMSEALG